MSVIADLKERKLFQWAVAYLAGAWLLMQLIDVIGVRWGIPDVVARFIDVSLITGFFITIVIAWYHGDQGRQRVSGPELLIIAGLLAVGGLGPGMLGTDLQAPPEPDSPPGLKMVSDQEPWIAVLPFRVQGDDAQLGHESEAHSAAEDLLQIWPTFEQDYYQQGLVKWIFGHPELIEQINDGLRKAGIDLVVANREDGS